MVFANSKELLIDSLNNDNHTEYQDLIKSWSDDNKEDFWHVCHNLTELSYKYGKESYPIEEDDLVDVENDLVSFINETSCENIELLFKLIEDKYRYTYEWKNTHFPTYCPSPENTIYKYSNDFRKKYLPAEIWNQIINDVEKLLQG